MRDGIILIDKPAGLSSAGVVARVKRALKAERVGHAGTLDPDATGLLIILINGATRVASYAADGYKLYSGEIQLGVTTSTDDLAGEISAQRPVVSSWDEVLRAAQMLTGRIEQIPPRVSAKKLGGKRAYKLQRAGEVFELAPRSCDVRRFEIEQTEVRERFRYRVEVSPGTYVRALARDLGEHLGCGAAVASIRREQSGFFTVAEAVPLDGVCWEQVRDWGALVPDLPRVSLPWEVIRGLIRGQKWALEDAWVAWKDTVAARPGVPVVYHAETESLSLGILKQLPLGGFEFGLNIARDPVVGRG
jgi:tRNA pseudouridine55 synthase